MSTKEANQVAVFDQLAKRAIKQKQASKLLGLSTRQVRRKLKCYRRQGVVGLIHLNRGRASNRRIDPVEVARAIQLVKTKYHDFGPTLAHEKLTELHQVRFSLERLRLAMITAGIWTAKQKRSPHLHQLRPRRACRGELVQLDGSPHDWFEGRGGVGSCTLLVYIDDATGKLLHLEFVDSESTWSYFTATRHYLEAHGKPLAYYCDRHGVLRVNSTQAGSASTTDSVALTQYGRAMRQMGIKLIYAHTPQAKGRVERANQTLQDRLVKEMRLAGISSMAEGNAYLPSFISAFNRKFAVKPRDSANLHRPLTQQDNLDDIFTIQSTRVLSKNLTCQYRNMLYQVQTNRPSYAMRHARVLVREDREGQVTLEYRGKKLAYSTLEKQPKSEIVDTKRINLVVDRIKTKQAPAVPYKPASNHPWRRYQAR